MALLTVIPLEPLLAAASASTGRDWSVVARLAGGYQQGAFRVVDASGQEAVLKPTAQLTTPRRVQQTAAVVAHARSHGWPTPEWWAFGCVGGRGWWLTEFVAGAAPEVVTVAFAQAVRPLIDRQAGLAPHTSQDWSSFTHSVVFGPHEYMACLDSFSQATAALVSTIRRLTHDATSVALPDDDLVHGNFDPGNVIFQSGRAVAIIDVEAIGKGTRAVDLAGLAINATVWGDDAAAVDLRDQAVAVAGPTVARICLGAAAAAVVFFGTQHWPGDADAVSRTCEAFLVELR